ncbi:hypothetical protein [Methylobacterium persicinum]|uniref:Uncharacterized protein n=1 Tax=Methylobacterium persicinum TaxID=374426 RepID=A0ABU0HQS0_9HYPH|nr:hypothetical protein [Methylobacterium persicinum]MDQ0444267.1 hypothetical protein [Methylobacterium persicinum]GJE36301.1 hypothetical protein KHHGKMAE_0349 [Methylobacterium persicinum]
MDARPQGAGTTGTGQAAAALARRLHGFRSLGDNCEFGFVQRYGGVEPSGLLRFAYTPMEDLIRGLRCGFADLGAPGDLHLTVSEGGAYYCHSRAYNIWANTGQTLGTVEAADLLEREYGRIAHLKRKMLDELSEGSLIFVRKVAAAEPEDDFARLSEAVWAHGPSVLLRVTEVGPGWRPEPARRVGDRLIEGRVRRFAPTAQAWEVDLEPWLHLIDGAWALVRDEAPTNLASGAFPEAMPIPDGLRRHAGRRRETGFNGFTRMVDAAGFDRNAVYTFTSWVWIPEGFGGERILAAAGYGRLAGCDADLSRRNCWQPVWASGRLTHAAREPIGLAMIGSGRDAFWSAGGRFSIGPIPGQGPAPPLPAPPAPYSGRDLVARLRARLA